MDVAICGENMRCGYSRCGVYYPDFDERMNQLKNQPARSGGGIDPFITGSWRTGHVRTSVYIPEFDERMEKAKKKG